MRFTDLRVAGWLAGVGIAVAMSGPVAHAADAANGAKIFRSHCSMCHAVQPNRNLIGPSLFGVVGRKAGTEPKYFYSVANRKSGLVWDPATLDKYLESPKTLVPHTKMNFPGLPDAGQRADVIAYLETLH